MSNDSDIEKYYTVAHSLVIKAGQIMREGYYGSKNIETKTAFYDTVTQYDNQIEDLLFKGLAAEFPDHKFIGEETAASEKMIPELTDTPTWIIDPIDGTFNFIKRIPHCCISVGLAVNKELVMGIVLNPIANELFTAKKGQGAYLNGERIYCSKIEKINDALIAYEVSLIHAPKVRDKHLKRFYKLGSYAGGSRSFGSAALSLCYVAKGTVDCYHIEDLQPWDMAAGVVLIREAGGVVYHSSGREFDIMKPDLVCAGTEALSQVMIGKINEANAMTHVNFE